MDEEDVGREVEGDAEKAVDASLVDRAREEALGHVELEEPVGRCECKAPDWLDTIFTKSHAASAITAGRRVPVPAWHGHAVVIAPAVARSLSSSNAWRSSSTVPKICTPSSCSSSVHRPIVPAHGAHRVSIHARHFCRAIRE